MSTKAATEDTLEELHAITADYIKKLMKSPKTRVQGTKMAIEFLHKNSITCVRNDVGAIGELDKELNKRVRRKFVVDDIACIATERAKRVINE